MALKLLIRAAVVAVGAISLATAPTAAADVNEDYFLNELYKTQQKWYWPYGEQYIVDLGRSVCNDLSMGVAYPDEVESIAVSKRWTHRNARFFIALATGAFCLDQYVTVVPPEDRLSAPSPAR